MTRREFSKVWEHLRVNCRPLAEDVCAGRLATFWAKLEPLQFEQAMKAAQFYIEKPDGDWFPTIGQFLAAMRESGELTMEEIRDTTDPELMAELALRRRDPEYAERKRHQDAEALEAAFQSPEHKALLETLRQPDVMSLRGGSLRKQ